MRAKRTWMAAVSEGLGGWWVGGNLTVQIHFAVGFGIGWAAK